MKLFGSTCTLIITVVVMGKVISQPDCPPCNCTVDETYRGVKASCSGLKLTSIPGTIPWKTTTLIMETNMMNLSLKAFPALKHLKYLDLADNDISEINDDAFTGLELLEVLCLDYNNLFRENTVFDPRFLKPLISLKNVSFQAESLLVNNITYECSSCPDSLEFLYIDFDSSRFGSSFLKLRRLSLLSLFYGGCSIPHLDNSTFQYTQYLEVLNISKCVVYYVKPGVLNSLQKLRKLYMNIDLRFGDEFQAFMEITKSLQFSPIEYISFTAQRASQSSPDTFLYLQNTSLRELHISCTNSPIIQRENFRKLPKSLVVLKLINIKYDSILTEIRYHPSLKTLDLSDLAFSHFPPKGFVVPMLSPILESYICRRCPELQGRSVALQKNVKIFITPLNKMRFFSYRKANSLSGIEYLDLSNNLIKEFRLVRNNKVTYLNLASNDLRNSLTGRNTITLHTLTNLKHLDLSDNGISLVSSDTFTNLHYVKVINLSNDHLDSINMRLIKLRKLEVLDLRNNKISVIGAAARGDFAQLPSTRLYLQNNPLICGCEQLEFLLWIKQNKEQFYDIPSLQCRMSTGEYKTLDNLDQIISYLQAQCKSDIFEISLSVCVTICVMTLVVGIQLYRHRWKLRYLYNAGRRAYRQQYNREQADQKLYDYDAFVSYDERDRRFVIDEMMTELEDKHGLRLCIHHRDFLPGDLISENIVNAIQNSRKTIVVLSPSFLESDWCEFEFNMARMEGVSRREDVVLVLLYEEVPMMKLTKDMATMLKRNCYLKYNHEAFNKEVFWLHVQESIQIIRPRD